MPAGSTVTKTLWQYSETLPGETMEFLNGVASDYCKVRNYVYGKYSGVRSINNLTPVYSILNEMRYCGLREQLNLPSVYYELAITDAVADIKSNWEIVKNQIGAKITTNENLSNDDRLYLRTVLKIGSVYAAVLNYEEYEMPKKAQGLSIDVKRLNNLLRRLTRRYLTAPKAEKTNWFRISPNGYSYKAGTIRIVCRVPRRRIVIPLKDDRIFDRQIRVNIKEDSVVLAIPVETKVKKHADYINTIYIHIGNRDMFTLSNGNVYGKSLETLTNPETERLARKNKERRKLYAVYEQNAGDGNLQKAENIETNNLGRLKYDRQKERERRRTETFINSEINRMLKEEKPAKIVTTRPVTKDKTKLPSKTVNRRLTRSFSSFIRERLTYKCKVNCIELVEINAKGTGRTCFKCGAQGKRLGKEFVCDDCGLKTAIAFNSAMNIQQKYNGSYVSV